MERKFLVKENDDLNYYGKGTHPLIKNRYYVCSCEKIISLLKDRDWDFSYFGSRTQKEGEQVVLDKLKVMRGTFCYGELEIELLNEVDILEELLK